MSALAEFEQPLTHRQLQFVAKAADGLTHDEIATHFHVSVSTVTNVLAEARERSGARNITHLAALCIAAGLILFED